MNALAATLTADFHCGMEMPQKLSLLMEERRLSQADVARAAGMQQTAVSRVLAGRQRLYLDQARRIAEFLKVPLDYLASDEQDAPQAGPMLTDDERTILKMSSVLGYDVAMLRLMSPPVIEQRPDPHGSGPTHWIAGPPR